MKRLKGILVIFCSASLLYGCVLAWVGIGVVGGIGTYKYIEGRLVRSYPIAYSRAWEITNSALENMQISISDSLDEGAQGKIEAVRKDGKKVTIKLKDMGQGVTEISIRVGILGDRAASEKIHDEIASVAGVR
jgi:hypothetical protein